MEDREHEEIRDLMPGLEVRVLFVEEMPIDVNGETVYADSYIWFASKIDGDSWFAFGLSTELDDPKEFVIDVDAEELRKSAIYLGESWETIQGDCPHCVAKRHKESKGAMPLEIYKDMMGKSDERLEELRDIGRWQAQSAMIEQMSGLKLSMN